MEIRNPKSEIRNHRPFSRPAQAGRAYTLVELLVVIAVIILLLSIAVPGLSKLMNAGKQDAAIGSFSAAVALSRSYAGRNPPFDLPFGYQGVAIVVTPANELRVAEHFEAATDGTTLLVAYNRAGYRDIANEPYVTLPQGVGVVGLTRTMATEERLVAPPFALRFDRNGHLIVRASTGGTAQPVVYDNDYDDVFDPADTRPNNYNPSLAWDPEFAGKGAANFNAARQKFVMEFGSLETVIGVIAYNKKDLRNALGADALIADTAAAPNLPDATRLWLLENGRVLFFNRYSGAVIKP